MDKDLPLIPTLIFLTSLVGSILVYMNNVQRLQPPLISQIFSDSRGNVWTLYKNQIMPIEHAYYDSLVTGYSLDKQEISHHVGQVIPLSSDELIVNRGGQETSLIHKIARFLRKKEKKSRVKNSSLMKCDLALVECASWGEPALHFKTATSGVELSNGNLVINDTARHQIYLVDNNGTILDKQQGFRFPNDSKQVGNKAWVVDTNNNRLVSFDITSTKLSRTAEIIELSNRNEIDKRHRFPPIAETSKSGWVVLSNENRMAYPGIYHIQGEHTERLLSDLKDVSAIHVAGSSLYAADYASHKIMKLNMDTGERTELAGPAIEFMQNNINTEIKEGKKSLYLKIGIILFVGLLALLISIRNSKPSRRYGKSNSKKDLVDPHILAKTDNNIVYPIWIEKNSWHLKRIALAEKIIRFCFISLLALCLVTAILALAKGGLFDAIKLIILIATTISLFTFCLAVIVRPRNNNFANKLLGTNGSTILVKDLKTREIETFDLTSIYWTNYELYSRGGGWIIWGNSAQQLYSVEAINRHILPLLPKKNQMSVGQLLFIRLKNREPVATMESIGVLSLAAIYLLYKTLL